jgi:diadenosine tetraphosphate (Ap4A) HIT family hydrolase
VGTADCVICQQGGPLDVIAELPAVWVSAPVRAVLPGYTCVVARRHVEEPFELPEPDAAAFWAESMSVAAAIHALVQPLRMNYEIHGNSIPHLHLHLYPRLVGDPFEGRPIDGRNTAFKRSPAEIARLRAAVGRLAH